MIKKVLAIFIVITALYIGFTRTPLNGWLWKGNVDTNVDVTSKTEAINIEISSIHTEIIPQEREDIAYEYNGKGKITLSSRGDTIELEARGPRLVHFNPHGEQLKIYLPQSYSRDLSVEVGSAKVAINKPETLGWLGLENLDLSVGSGKIELAALQAKETDISVSSGDIFIDELQAEEGSFTVSSGSMKLKDYSGSMEANISSGDFQAGMKELSGSLDIKVSSGHAAIDLPDDASFVLEGEFSSGRIEHAFDLKDVTSNKNSISGTHNSGKHAIELDVSSGHISLK